MDDDTYKEQLKTQNDKSRLMKEHQRMDSQVNLLGGLGNLGGLGGGLGGLGALLGAQSAQAQLLTMLNTKGGDPINSSVFVSNVSLCKFFYICYIYIEVFF